MGDPIFNNGFDLAVFLIVSAKTLVVFAALLVATMLVIWFERKVIADMQNRIGPNRAGPFGVLQSLADGIKFFFKEDLLPTQADKLVFRLAPALAAVPAFIAFSIVPMGPTLEIAGHRTLFQLADPPIGILLLLAMSSVAVYGVMLAGWSSGSKYPLLGSVRATAQMISYEAAMGLSVAAVVLVAGSLSTSRIVAEQATWNWNLWQLGVVPFVIFLIASTAELNRPPFDLVEADAELVGGYNTEYGGARFASFFFAEYLNVLVVSGIATTVFLGGWLIPGIDTPGWAQPLVVLGKMMIFVFVFIWVRATLPRLRYDQLMSFGWKVLLPLATLNVLVTAIVVTL